MSARIEMAPPTSARARCDAVLIWLPQLLWIAGTTGAAVVLLTLGVPFPAVLPLLSIAATVAVLVVRREVTAQLTNRRLAEDHAIRRALAESGHDVETQADAGLAR
jgi:membrane protein implicated in regulation of membrane protease activity